MKKLQFARLVMAGALLGGARIANADTVAGVGWGFGQSSVVCYLFNAGSGPVSVTSFSIVGESGNSYQISSTGCGTPIASGKFCNFSAVVPATGGATACYAVLSPSGAGVRGEIEIRNASGTVLNSGLIR